MYSCQVEPELYLCDHTIEVNDSFAIVDFDIDVLWNYETEPDWRLEWKYGWTEEDSAYFHSPIGYTKPWDFEVRRYLMEQPNMPHNAPIKDYITEPYLRAKYKLGWYDFLIWSEPHAWDDILSIHIDEETSNDSVAAYTNRAVNASASPYPGSDGTAIPVVYQPDEEFVTSYDNLHISQDPADYDSVIVDKKGIYTYYKKLDFVMQPVTYIYLTQIILHNNDGRIVSTDGISYFSGMARSVCFNTRKNGYDEVTIGYSNRMKKGVTLNTGEIVDICGGRLTTFGIPRVNPMTYSRAEAPDTTVLHNYMDVNFTFSNEMDSTLVFDVTSQVRRKYHGGVITIDLDVDKIPLPQHGGGSSFDAVVVDPDEEKHEIDF